MNILGRKSRRAMTDRSLESAKGANRFGWALSALAIGLLMGVAPARAQVVSSTLVGTVTDSSQGSVPNATVRATETSTGTVQSTKTTADGLYNLTFLSPGTYKVTVEAQGFKTFSQDNIVLGVSTTVRVDAILAPGSAQETVTVTAESPLLQTEHAEVGRNIAAQAVVDLPMEQRNPEGLGSLLAGAAPPSGGTPTFNDPGGTTTYSVNGLGSSANNTIMDGSDDREMVLAFTINVPPPEMVEEVHVATNSYSAEFGRVGGAVINIVSKGGSNELHGALWEFNRVSALAARNFFNVSGAKPKLTYNNFGAILNGPIKKNKTFFLGGYHGLRSDGSTFSTYTVPATQWLGGNFSAVPSLALYDPNTGNANGTGRTPFPNNTIPASELNPAAQKINQYFPVPNLASTPLTLGYTTNYGASVPTIVLSHSVDGRIDQYFSDSTKMFARVNRTWANDVTDAVLGDVIGNGLVAHDGTLSTIANLTHSFSPTFLSELRLSYTRWVFNASGIPTALNNQGLGIVDPTPTPTSTTGIASFSVSGYPAIGEPVNYPAIYTTNIFSVNNTWSKVKGKHVVKWGGVITRIREEQNQPQGLNLGPRGLFVFNTDTTQLNGGPGLGSFGAYANAFAAFLLGAPDQDGRTYLTTTPTNRQTQAAAFVQDTYQVTRRLTLDIGLRYELFTPVAVRLPGGGGNYDFTTNTYLIAGYGAIPLNTGVHMEKGDFGPRAGWAYRLSDKSVLRGGFGISRFVGSLGFDGGTLCCQFPAVGNIQVGTPNDYIVEPIKSIPGIPVIPLPLNGVLNPAPDQAYFSVPFHTRNPYVMNYNFTYQRQLPRQMSVDVGFVGDLARELTFTGAPNASAPGTGNAGDPLFQLFGHTSAVQDRTTGLNSHYNGLQSTLSKRLSNGLTFSIAYAYSRNLGESTSPDILDFKRNYGPVNNYKHLLTISHTYALPFGEGKRFVNKGGPVGFVVSNWQLNGIFRYRFGADLTPSASATTCNCPGNSQVANVVGPTQYLGGIGAGSPWLSTSGFAVPGANVFGNAGNGIIVGPSMKNYDLSVFRNFAIWEHLKLQYRAEFYHFTNTPFFGNPSTNISSPSTFGAITSASNSREIQMALRLTF
jgi:outer membrane receptor protein involved in Fe transport